MKLRKEAPQTNLRGEGGWGGDRGTLGGAIGLEGLSEHGKKRFGRNRRGKTETSKGEKFHQVVGGALEKGGGGQEKRAGGVQKAKRSSGPVCFGISPKIAP